MAIAFELVVNFGSNEAAADSAYEFVVGQAPLLTVGDTSVGLHEPLLNLTRGGDGVSYLLMSVLPIGVGWGVALDRGQEHLRLTAGELTEVGHGLYQLLARFTGYQAAKVGWNPEGFVDPLELRQEWPDELAAGTLPGLVLADTLLADLRGQAFRPFSPGFVWIRYAGQQPSTVTADEPIA
jgi:hypothetical protein